MPLIIIMIFILYSVVIGWTWNNLGDIDKIKKILIIAGEIFAICLITLIVYAISKNGIDYTNEKVENSVKIIIVSLFTGFNSLIILPFLNKQIIKLKEKEEKFIATVACKAAVKANMVLTVEEVDNLMDQLLKLPNPFTCPHGRPTAIKMTKYDIERKFSRK